jgi:hypothetical protein
MGAVALLIAWPLRAGVLAVATLLVGFGLLFDSASALLAAPVLAWFGLSYLRSRRQWLEILVGAVLPAALLVYTRVFYARHPDYVLHPSPSLRGSWHTLAASTHHLDQFFSLYAPEVFRSWLVPVLVLLVLIGVLVATRRAAYAIPAVLSGFVAVYAMATPRAASDQGPLLPRGRILLALPATIWFLCFLAAERGVFARLRLQLGARTVVAGLCLLCVASTGLRVLDYGPREGRWRSTAITARSLFDYRFTPRRTVVHQCEDDLAVARSNQVALLVYPDSDRLAAYACAVQQSGQVETLVPSYERRTWLLYAKLRQPGSRLLFAHVPARFCDLARQHASCAWTHGDVLLAFPTQPPLRLLASLGINIRGFGPHCHPRLLLSVYCRDHNGADLTRRPFADPPANPDAARIDIIAAYAHMFDVTPGTATFPAVEEGDQFPDVAHALATAPTIKLAQQVDSVEFLDDHEAVVRYRANGTLRTGEAVLQAGTWRVSVETFCLTLPQTFAPGAVTPLRNGCDTRRFQ